MMTKQTKFILAVLIQLVIIFAIIIFKLSILAGGTEVLLRIAPVDPRDWLRGDYVTFKYSISNVDSYYPQGQQIRNGDTVYVILRQSGKYWTAQKVQMTRPAGGELFIKGKVESGGVEEYGSNFIPPPIPRLTDSRLRIVYGIEQYFIPEGKGQGFNFRNRDAGAKVAIGSSGNAVLKQIYVDDKPWPQGEDKIDIFSGDEKELKSFLAKDAVVKANLSDERAYAELYYDSQSSYLGMCADRLPSLREALKNVMPQLICKDGEEDYAISASLASGGFWCVDSTGVSKLTDQPNIGTICPK